MVEEQLLEDFRDTDLGIILLYWIHTQGTEADRAKIYINGTQDTRFQIQKLYQVKIILMEFFK